MTTLDPRPNRDSTPKSSVFTLHHLISLPIGMVGYLDISYSTASGSSIHPSILMLSACNSFRNTFLILLQCSKQFNFKRLVTCFDSPLGSSLSTKVHSNEGTPSIVKSRTVSVNYLNYFFIKLFIMKFWSRHITASSTYIHSKILPFTNTV